MRRLIAVLVVCGLTYWLWPATSTPQAASRHRNVVIGLDALRALQAAQSAARMTPTPTHSPRVATPRPISRSRPITVTDSTWRRLALCESGLRLDAHGGRGKYHGAFQFLLSTWRSVGGKGDPHNASWDEQLLRAQILAARANPFTQWPVCWPRAIRG